MCPSQDESDGTSTATLAVETKSQLLRCLSRVNDTASFATFAACPLAANPGIVIEKTGSVGLPLSDRDAKAIIEVSHRAPFGRGSETVVDTDVRKTWELNADQFQLVNPAWQETLGNITERVQVELGLRTGIKAMPYKMLLYEEGAMFKPHKEYAAEFLL